MKIMKIIGLIILVLLIIIAFLGLVSPGEYEVERSITIHSPRELVFDHVKYWRNWQDWSPWAKLDSAMQVTIEGIDGQEGSLYKWSGEKTGKGEMINTGIKENAEIDYHLHFLEPMDSESEGYVRLVDKDGGSSATKVAWGMYGKESFPWNVFMLVMNMDKMVGKDFERGLELLKELSDKEAADVNKYQVKSLDYGTKNYAVIREVVPFTQIADFFTRSFPKIGKVLKENKVKMNGAPLGLYFSYDEQKQITDMAAAVQVSKKVESGEIKMFSMPAGKSYVIDYYGPYAQSAAAYKALDLYFHENNLKRKAPVIEEYITDPLMEPDSSKWLTKIYYFTQ